ncbi:Piso0_005293 [Millerozyma farinosa CBS 7064]|uniref:Piso0_005293 protein n=1 Tax=Pichia sorbitophila (strain ATCC MYA-4447 / BCRC 22081 / CBS 7064 / NBRC 10061 / NRRL Y-12695) TaxID=559304 RepID=G8Y1S8_PICSO|nr:Piso0_005293 [Millerozyma farinosa CBS 7064]
MAQEASSSSAAGIVAGGNPFEYSSSAPYTLFLFQAVFIILVCQGLHYPLSKLRQPRVIAEVIGGIVLGPSVLGRIPNFTKTCFPPSSIPGLTLLANIGIILFLFILGLEVDLSFVKKHLTAAFSVGLINMAIPFGLGCGIARGIYNDYVLEGVDSESNKPVKFTTYMVFIAVAMCITAFPVLARILTELNLIGDRVGTIVLAAGIMNDLTGWILLALVVSLANATKSVNTVYILLLAVGWFIFLYFPVKRVMYFLLRRFTNDLSTGEPSQISILFILLLVFTSSWFTDIIGVHPIFGAFMAGVIVPRDNGYVIKITEKLEDLVHIVLIPIYFAIAGLNVNLGLLNRGLDWAYIVGIILLAMFGKIVGGLFAAKLNKLLWRESLAVGILMSCKGIVEIVVLNVGLSSGIISQRVYSMFVVMALITTFSTTPLTIWVYPISYRTKLEKYLKQEITWDGQPLVKEGQDDEHDDSFSLLTETKSLEGKNIESLGNFRITKIIIIMKNIESISHIMPFLHDITTSSELENNYPIDVKAIQLREFTSRTSHLLEASSHTIEEDSSAPLDLEQSNVSLLVIMKMFNDLMGNHFSSKSILSSFRNHVFSINDQVSETSNLLIASMKIPIFEDGHIHSEVNSSVDSSDALLVKRLFSSSKCHFGVLMYNDVNKGAYEDKEDTHIISAERTRPFFTVKSANIVLNQDNLLSSSDLLALHVVYKLAFNLTEVNVYIISSSKSTGFAKQIECLLSEKKDVKLSINLKKDFSELEECIMKSKLSHEKELFVVANNIAKENDDRLFSEEVVRLLDISVTQGFNVLALRAAN